MTGDTMDHNGPTVWKGPLQGLRVLDFTRVLAGPSATLALADLGAEIIKIEPPNGGDETRSFPPIRRGESHYFLSINRGKKSIVIDLKSEQGVNLVRELVADCDILVENYRPGVMERLGLGYEAMRAVNPQLIYCAISGFGMDGPLRDRPSFDIVMQALSGALSVNGELGAPPTKLGIPLGDLVGGINGPIAILAAVHERHQTGKGCLIDVSLFDGMLGMLGYLAQLAIFNGENPQPQGGQHPNLVPYGIFPAADGAIVIACLTNNFWGRICNALGMSKYTHDERYSSIERRRDAREVVNALIAERTRIKPMHELIDLFVQHEVPHAPILGVNEALTQPHAQARNMVVDVAHQTLGTIPIVNRPFKFPGRDMPTPEAPPVLGQHTDTILSEIVGLNAEQIAKLRALKIIA